MPSKDKCRKCSHVAHAKKLCRKHYDAHRRDCDTYRAKHRERVHWGRLEGYGLSKECSKKLKEIQKHKCGICSRPLLDDRAYSHLDHDPVSGKARGYLCTRCNTGIGKLGDSPAGLRKALNYLENPPAKKVLK